MSSDNKGKDAKFKFLGSNVYQIGMQGKASAKAGTGVNGVRKNGVLKAGTDLLPSVQVGDFVPKNLLTPSVASSLYGAASSGAATSGANSKDAHKNNEILSKSESDLAIHEMKNNLKILQQLQARLRFVLKELETIVTD